MFSVGPKQAFREAIFRRTIPLVLLEVHSSLVRLVHVALQRQMGLSLFLGQIKQTAEGMSHSFRHPLYCLNDWFLDVSWSPGEGASLDSVRLVLSRLKTPPCTTYYLFYPCYQSKLFWFGKKGKLLNEIKPDRGYFRLEHRIPTWIKTRKFKSKSVQSETQKWRLTERAELAKNRCQSLGKTNR